MFRQLTTRLLLTVVAVVCLLLAGPTPARAQETTDALGVLTAQIEAARAAHAQQLDQFEVERLRFDALLQRIDQLKEGREETSTIVSDDALRDALREARSMARALREENDELRALAERATELEDRLLTDVDTQIAELEARLRTAGSAEAGEILTELESLASLREQHLQPLPEVPEINLDEILLGLEDETTPEELRATAEELDDNERRLSDHLTEVEDRIDALESQIQLQQRAREFRAELQVFEEGVSEGRVAEQRPSAAADTSRDDDSSGSSQDDSTGSAPPSAGQGSPTEGGGDNRTADDEVAEPTDSGDSTSGGEGAWPTPAMGGAGEAPAADDGDTSYDADSSGVNDGFTGRADSDSDGQAPGSVDVQPDVPVVGLSPSLNPVAAPQGDQTILWVGQSDLEESADVGLAARLERLRAEREETRRTIEELRERRSQLLERADHLEALEGF